MAILVFSAHATNFRAFSLSIQIHNFFKSRWLAIFIARYAPYTSVAVESTALQTLVEPCTPDSGPNENAETAKPFPLIFLKAPSDKKLLCLLTPILGD